RPRLLGPRLRRLSRPRRVGHARLVAALARRSDRKPYRPGRSSGMTALQSWYNATDSAARELALDPVERAVADIAAGRPVVVVDDENRENEGDLVIAAEKATPEIVAFMMSECRGLICAPMEGAELDRLELPQMVENNTESMKTA